MLLKLVREGLGRLIAGISYLTLPKPTERTEDAQQAVDEACKKLALYQFFACPFCIKVRREIHHLNLSIETRDAQNNETHRAALLNEGGAIKVPCLKIEHDDGKTEWMYESSDIIDYLQKRFK